MSSERAEVHPSLQEFCERILVRVADVRAILISTSDGVPIVNAISPQVGDANFVGPLETELAQYFSMAAHQASKMNLGGLKSTLTFYANVTVLHVNLAPLVVTCVHENDAAGGNVGATLDIIPELQEALEPVRAQVEHVYEREGGLACRV